MEIKTKTLMATLIESGDETQITIVEVIGDIDGKTAPDVQAQTLEAAKSTSKLILDLTQVPYMSSAGLRVMLSAYRYISSQQGQVVLVGLCENIKDTMSVTGFLDFFVTCETVNDSLAELKVQATAVSH
jgi:anti-sigma B factor antagonist